MITKIIGLKKTDSKIKKLLEELGDHFEYDTYGGLFIYDFPILGICLYFDENDILVTVFLHSEGHDDHCEYSNELPHGFAFSDTKKCVNEKLGQPEKSGKNWDRYRLDNYFIHFEYSDEWAINLITIMAPQFAED